MRGKAWYVAQPAQMLLLLMAIMCGQWLQSCLTLLNSMACSPPGSSVHGILQATVLEWVAMPFSGGSAQPRDQTHVSCIAGGPSKPPGKPLTFIISLNFYTDVEEGTLVLFYKKINKIFILKITAL